MIQTNGIWYLFGWQRRSVTTADHRQTVTEVRSDRHKKEKFVMNIRFEMEQKRAAAYDGEKLAGECDFLELPAFWIITHTEVDPAYGGQGIAGALVDCVVQAAKTMNKKIKPFCSYARKLFEKNPEYRELEDTSRITIFGMPSCPDCSYLEPQIAGNPSFQFVDIGSHVRYLKAFLKIRDMSAVFDEAKQNGSVGIPCFVLEDGMVILRPEDVGLVSRPASAPAAGKACRIDGTGC